jgi:hypothetical protein
MTLAKMPIPGPMGLATDRVRTWISVPATRSQAAGSSPATGHGGQHVVRDQPEQVQINLQCDAD